MQNEFKFLIGNDWRESKNVLEVKNPYNNDIIGVTYLAVEDDVTDAIQKAVCAFKETRKLPAYKRAEILCNIKNGILERKEDFARSIALEAGKPIVDSRHEVERAICTFQIAMEEAKRISGEYISLDISERSKNRNAIHKRFPIGPIFGITPFNFPLNLVVHKIAPAIASGNTIIIKPASKTPLTALLLGKVISESGLPNGAFSVFPCSPGLAEQIIADDRIKILTFTGSAEVGWRLKQIANKKRVTLELGGNAGTIIDCNDNIDYAVRRCMTSAFSYSGQVCISLQRLFINKIIYSDFMSKFLKEIKTLKMGNPMDENTKLGPMIDEQSSKRAELWIKEAVSHGAVITCGGLRKGVFFEPTVVTNTTSQMKINANEVFAPVVTVTEYESFEDAVEQLNNSVYGLQAGIFTNNIKHVFYAYEHLDVGGVIINDVPSFRADNMPYGGAKESGIGREGVRYAMEEMTEHKLLVLNLS